MRLVFDCNVIISASLVRNSVPSRALRIAEDFHTLLVSPDTIQELSQTILRKKFDRYFKPIDTRVEIISRYSNKAEWVVPTHKITICRDPKDNRYLELSLSGKADYIITGDPDLLTLNSFGTIPIITAKQFLNIFEAK